MDDVRPLYRARSESELRIGLFGGRILHHRNALIAKEQAVFDVEFLRPFCSDFDRCSAAAQQAILQSHL